MHMYLSRGEGSEMIFCFYFSQSQPLPSHPVLTYGLVRGVGVFAQVTATHHCTDVVSLHRRASTTTRAILY